MVAVLLSWIVAFSGHTRLIYEQTIASFVVNYIDENNKCIAHVNWAWNRFYNLRAEMKHKLYLYVAVKKNIENKSRERLSC